MKVVYIIHSLLAFLFFPPQFSSKCEDEMRRRSVKVQTDAGSYSVNVDTL